MNDDAALSFIKIITDNGFGYLWFIFLAAWGGTANYITRLRHDKTPFSLVELLGEWVISGFAGLLTAFVCQEMDMGFAMTAASAGISGHMGGRGIQLLERFVQRRLGANKDNG